MIRMHLQRPYEPAVEFRQLAVQRRMMDIDQEINQFTVGFLVPIDHRRCIGGIQRRFQLGLQLFEGDSGLLQRAFDFTAAAAAGIDAQLFQSFAEARVLQSDITDQAAVVFSLRNQAG